MGITAKLHIYQSCHSLYYTLYRSFLQSHLDYAEIFITKKIT